jgi:hypothetical protein
MPVTYINRKEDIYYLHKGKTKTGKPKYFFSKKRNNNLVEKIPDGYEIYENPNAKVFLRKKLVSLITDAELALVENGIKKYADLKFFIIDRRERTITIYLPDQDIDELKSIIEGFSIVLVKDLDNTIAKLFTYSPMLRFTLTDETKRKYLVERYCFLGSIDDWIDLESSMSLEKMVKKYCIHLGKESFFDLI